MAEVLIEYLHAILAPSQQRPANADAARSRLGFRATMVEVSSK